MSNFKFRSADKRRPTTPVKSKGISKISDYFQKYDAGSSSTTKSRFRPMQDRGDEVTNDAESTLKFPGGAPEGKGDYIISTSVVSDDSDIEIVGYESKTSDREFTSQNHPRSSLISSKESSLSDNVMHETIKLCETTETESMYFTERTQNDKTRTGNRLSLKRKRTQPVIDEEEKSLTASSEKLSRTVSDDIDRAPLFSPNNIPSKIKCEDYTSKSVDRADLDLDLDLIISSKHNSQNETDKLNQEDSSDLTNDQISSSEPLSKTLRVPYYLQNFKTVLEAVMEDDTSTHLFDEKDYKIMKHFSDLSDGAKKLYVRMFSRKLKWIPQNKLNYDEIADDLCPYLKELVDVEFIDCEDDLNDLKEVLGALPAGDIKTLAKSYHVTTKITQKKNLVQELFKKSQQTSVSLMLGNKGGGLAAAMLKSAKDKLRGIYKLRLEPRSVFVRVLMLFSVVNTTGDEDDGSGGQHQLFQMLMVNMGKVVFPTYEVKKKSKIFKNRDDVIRFEQALQLESDLLKDIEKGDWQCAYNTYKNVVKKVESLEKNKDIEEWNTNLPDFLRSFTAASLLYRLLSVGIDIIQRRKEFQEAVKLLRKLLAQTTYCNTHRGYWWERLALNLDVHLKDPKQSLEAVGKGLADRHVKVGHRLALYQRAEAICQRPHLKLQKQLRNFHHEPIRELPKVFIEGRVLHQGVTTSGPRFLTESSYTNGNAHDMTVCGVEEFVMDYYKNNGFPSSVHAEGSIVSGLFGLCFWDILFMSIPDAFHSPYQAMPLDLYSESFYFRRKDVIDKRIRELKESSSEELCERLEETWTNNHGVLCIGMSWDRIQSLDNMKELVTCMGGKFLSGILERYAKCPRHTRSGFPDLTLWNTQTKTFKICEVKGPGDKLSHKQILWIDYLLGLGVDAEVCHVKAVAAKKLKPSSVT